MLVLRYLFVTIFLATIGALPISKIAQAQVMQNITVSDIAGEYSVNGRNPDGSAYKGRVTISDVDGVANFVWKVSGQTYKGQGNFIGNVLVVNWGSSHPVLYTVDLDGNLAGTWNDGLASEKLVRK